MARFRKIPVEIEAWQWSGEKAGEMRGVCQCREYNTQPHVHTIHTSDFAHKGQMVFLKPGDWIVPEADGIHFYPVKADIFAKTYEPIGGGA